MQIWYLGGCVQTISEQDEELPGVTSSSSLPGNSLEPRNGPTKDELLFLCFVFVFFGWLKQITRFSVEAENGRICNYFF